MFDLEEIKTKLKNFFSQKPEIKFAYLFGSLARKKINKLSDIDLAVYINEKLVNEKNILLAIKHL